MIYYTGNSKSEKANVFELSTKYKQMEGARFRIVKIMKENTCNFVNMLL